MYAGYGLGRDTDIVGSYVTFGFGILELFPEGLIAIVNDVVYREIRSMLVQAENREIIIRKENIC